jgi:hypothetical protein
MNIKKDLPSLRLQDEMRLKLFKILKFVNSTIWDHILKMSDDISFFYL